MRRLILLFGVVTATLLLLGEAEAQNRTLVFRYTSPDEIFPSYVNARIEFSIQRVGEERRSVFVNGPSQAATPIVMTDDGSSVLRPYLVNAYVQPVIRRLPFPVFEAETPGRFTMQVDNGPEVFVQMIINLFGSPGPMAVTLVF